MVIIDIYQRQTVDLQFQITGFFKYEVQGSIGRIVALATRRRFRVETRKTGLGEIELWIASYGWLLPLGGSPTQFRHGDILQLPVSLFGQSEILSNFLVL